MRILANYILSGRLQAIGTVSIFSTFSLLVPPLAFLLSGVPVGLVTLRKGSSQAFQVISGSFLVMCLFTLLMDVQAMLAAVILASVWVPVYLCALSLRFTERPAVMAQVAALIAALYVVFMYIGVDNVEQWWRQVLGEVLEAGLPPAASAQYQQAMELAPALMNAVVASSIVFSLVITVLIARAWQSALFNPGGFGREFRGFSLPKQLVVPVLLGMATLFLEAHAYTPLIRDLLVVAVVLYLFQGIASIHRTVKSKGLSRNWLIGMYFLLAFLPQIMVIFIAWIGMTDSLLGVRSSTGDSGPQG